MAEQYGCPYERPDAAAQGIPPADSDHRLRASGPQRRAMRQPDAEQSRPNARAGQGVCRPCWFLAALAAAVCLAASAPGCKLMPLKRTAQDRAAEKSKQAERVRQLAEEGLKFEQVGNDRRAYKAYKAALKLAGQSAWLHHRLAAVCDRMAKFDEAEHHYLRALALSPRDPDLHNDLGYSYYLQGRLAEAECELRTCLRLSPSHSYAHVNLGLVLGRMGNVQESLKQFQMAGMNQEQAYASLAFVLPKPRRSPAAGHGQLAQHAQPDIPPSLQRYFEPAQKPASPAADSAVRLGQHLEPAQ